jgi:hypothetical protein
MITLKLSPWLISTSKELLMSTLSNSLMGSSLVTTLPEPVRVTGTRPEIKATAINRIKILDLHTFGNILLSI